MTKEPLDITSEEMDKIREAMKKEEFRKLLCEYAEELADPVKRQQYEDELIELESQRGVQMKFIKPDPGFVIKIMDHEANKVFVNVCMSELVQKPQFEFKVRTPDNGKVEHGQQCQIPYSVSPPHDERDNKGVVCKVYDVVFHPEVLVRSSNTKFKDMIVDTALNAISSQFQLRLDRASMKFPKILFKGTPTQSVIRQRVDEEKPGTFDHLPKRPDFPDLPAEKKEDPKKKKKEPEKPKKPEDEPDYKIVFRNDVDLGNFTNDRVGSSCPTHIIVTIKLPLHQSTRDVDLDVYPDQLELHSKHYNLTLNFPYTVDSDRGSAKFDKEKRELKVTLEVVAKEIPRELIETVPEPSLVQEISAQNQSEPSLVQEIPAQNQSEPSLVQEISAQNQSEAPGGSRDVYHGDVSTIDTKRVSEPFVEIQPVSKHCSDFTTSETQSEIKLADPSETQSKTKNETSNEAAAEQCTELSDIQVSVDETRQTSKPPPLPLQDFVHASETPTLEPPKSPTRFSVSPVPCNTEHRYNTAGDSCCETQNINSEEHVAHKVETENKANQEIKEEINQESDVKKDDPLANIENHEDNSSYSGLSSYTDISIENDISVNIRVYQDTTTATLLLDAVYNSVPDVTLSGKTIWLKNEDIVLYLLLPHTITTYTIDMNNENVCLVLYKQHPNLWNNLHIGHSEDEVFSYKFITEENVDNLVGSFRDPWAATPGEHNIISDVKHTDTETIISCKTSPLNNRPDNILINSPELSDDDAIRGILKSPYSPSSPTRCRKVSFNEEVETFVLPSKRSLKGGKRRRKKKNGSNSASESSDDSSSPNSVVPDPKSISSDPISNGDMRLESADSCTNNKKNRNKIKNSYSQQKKEENSPSQENKENLLNSEQEAVQKVLDPTGSAAHQMKLTNSLIYELDD